LFAVAGTSKEIIAKLHAEIGKALNNPEVKDKLAAQGAEILTGTPEQFAAMLKDDLAKWAKIVQASGATVD
jgi:tripartite-type tricarboxylate transporter receptor subunit TctC